MSAVPAPGDRHYTASVVILTPTSPTKVLLVHHKKLGKWIQPGGHQEPQENFRDAAIREAREETGLDISGLIPAPVRFDEYSERLPLPAYILEERIPPHGEQPEHYHLDMTYVVRLPEQTVTREQSGAHDIRWFTLEQVQSLDTFEELQQILGQLMTGGELA